MNAEPAAVLQPIEPTVERFDPSVRVSGAVFVAGAMFRGDRLSEDRPSLIARVPASWAGEKICLRGISLDGAYESQYIYSVPRNWDRERLDLLGFAYPTAYPDLVADRPGGGLGVTLSRGDCVLAPDEFLLGYWNEIAPQQPDSIILQLNALGADRVVVFVGDDPHANAIPCMRTQNNASRAFDYLCNIPTDTVEKFPIDVEIVSVRSGFSDPSRYIRLVAP